MARRLLYFPSAVSSNLWTPLELGANLDFWFTTSDASTITLSTGNDVETWNDKTGTYSIGKVGYFSYVQYAVTTGSNNLPCMFNEFDLNDAGFDGVGGSPETTLSNEIWALAFYRDGDPMTHNSWAIDRECLFHNSYNHGWAPNVAGGRAGNRRLQYGNGDYYLNADPIPAVDWFDPSQTGPDYRIAEICVIQNNNYTRDTGGSIVAFAGYNGPPFQDSTSWRGGLFDLIGVKTPLTGQDKEKMEGFLFWQGHDGNNFGGYVPPLHPYIDDPPTV